jgi:tripartite-type tricarboxylate transporter receptor subunit TctC
VAAVALANAQSYPSRLIRIVVPFAAAGTSDLVARILAQELNKAWNVPVIVDNRPGAGGNIGSDAAARSVPDGYTLLLGTVATHGINASLYKNLPYDPVKDFVPVSLVASSPSVLEVNRSLPVNSVSELIAYAKQNPSKLFFGSAGNGSSHHLAGALFNSMAGVEMVHVPYRGTGAAMTDLLAGQIQVIFDTLPSAMSFVQSDQVKVLGVSGSTRDPSLPDVPTISEVALPGYEVASWYGILAPAGTPLEVVRKINAEIARIVRDPSIRDKLVAQGAAPVGGEPEEFASFIEREIAKWAVVVKQSGAVVN